MAISLQERKIRDSISSRGKVVCSLDASPVVDLFASIPSFSGLRNAIGRIRAVTKSLVLSVEVISFAVLWGASGLSLI